MTRRTFVTRAVLAAAGTTARSETTKSQQQGRQLIDACILALGGPAFLNMQDRLEMGRAYSFYRERLSGLSIARLRTRYAAQPRPKPVSYFGILERQTFGKKQDNSVLFLPDSAFELTFRGARPLPDETVQKHRESTVTNILYILRQRLDEPGISFEYSGISVVDNRQVEAIDIYDSAQRQVTVYLNVRDHLPVMQRYMRFDSFYKERIEEIARFSKYHPAGDGVMWPLDISRERDGEKIYQMFSDSVSINNNFDASLFTLPGGIQLLKKENF